MAGKSDYLENKLLDHVLNGVAYSSPASVYVGLYTSAPTDAGGGTEVSGGSYARVQMTGGFDTASGGATANTAAITFPTSSGAWGTVTHFGIFDASTNGNLLYWGALAASKTIASGDIAKFNAGELDITED